MNFLQKFRAALIVGLLIVVWDFICFFSGWVVAPQREISASTLIFCFSGLFPLIGFVAVWAKRRWGAWLMLASPWIGCLGLFGLHDVQKREIGWFFLLFVLPTSSLGLMFQKLFNSAGSRTENRLQI